MVCDSEKLNLTREKALELHRQMWMEMQEKLGDCPSAKDRDNFKANWCAEHFPNHSILNDCFLCDYVHHDFAATTYCLTRCPIDWESLKKYSYQTTDCCAVYKEYDGDDDDEENEIHYTAPISEILALPEREVKRMKKNLPLIFGIVMIGFMACQIKNGSMAWAIIDLVFAVVNLAIWFTRDKT